MPTYSGGLGMLAGDMVRSAADLEFPLVAVTLVHRKGCFRLDVYEEEEGIFFEDHSSHMLLDDELSRLLSFPNVLITAHQAFLTQEALSEIARVTAENILKLETGEPFLPATTL